MVVPILIDEIRFDEGIHAVAASLDGDMIAVGTKGLLGVYELRREAGKVGLVHIASYVVPGDGEYAVTSVFFSADGGRIHIRSEDGFERELAFNDRKRGMLVEVTRKRVDNNRTDHIIGARAQVA